jgi:cyclopropane fatty-acyl-phospholipid synthase-like methyltransferase
MEPVPAHATSATDPTVRARPPSVPEEKGRGHALSFVFFLLEQSRLVLFAIPAVIAAAVTAVAEGGVTTFVLAYLGAVVIGLGGPIAALILGSRRAHGPGTDWEPYVSFRDPEEARRYAGKRIPMEILYEAYLSERLDFRGDVLTTLLRRNQLFRFSFTWGDIRFYLTKFLRQNLDHRPKADREDIAPVYDRGNDFYEWFLGEGMVYTSGIFHDPSESLETAQERKLETVCRYVQMRPGDRHLDVGCGWGSLLTHAALRHGTQGTGITLSAEQASWAKDRAQAAGVADRVRLIVDDYRNLPSEKYDKITCLEMAEHVGVRNFQRFLLQIRGMLEDDGIFYLQIAGLRRAWQYEDLVWGLFMAKYVFPGADASCPLGFVVSQAERAGFEVHRVENCGPHYSMTIQKWYENWTRNEAAVVEKYGERWFRTWKLFLAWSMLIAAQGSSAVFMITLAKNLANDKSSVTPDEARGVAYSRRDRWVGKDTVATQR